MKLVSGAMICTALACCIPPSYAAQQAVPAPIDAPEIHFLAEQYKLPNGLQVICTRTTNCPSWR